MACKTARGHRTRSTFRLASGRRPSESGISAFKTMRRRLSNAVAELGTRHPCKLLNQRLCCLETSDRNAVDTRCDQNRKSIRDRGKDSQKAIFARAIKCVAGNKPPGPARSGRPNDRRREFRERQSSPERLFLKACLGVIGRNQAPDEV